MLTGVGQVCHGYIRGINMDIETTKACSLLLYSPSDLVLGVFGKLSMRRRRRREVRAWALLHDDIWTCGAKVLEY